MSLIDHYEFGLIKIDGVEYRSDVIVFPDRVQDNWVRRDGHNLSMADLNTVIEYQPEVLLIGNGNLGFMKVSDAVRDGLLAKGIFVELFKTNLAWMRFNELMTMKSKVVAALHLTC
ncbi:MAG: MTH938/NDUFAF3 family protein [bacterium]